MLSSFAVVGGRRPGDEEHTHGEVREETSDDDLRPGSAVAGGAPKRIFSLPASRARRPKARAGQRDGWATATECQRFIICFRFADRSVLLTGLARAVGRGAEGRCLDKKKLGAGSYDMDLLHFSSSGGSMPVCRYRQVQDIRLI